MDIDKLKGMAIDDFYLLLENGIHPENCYTVTKGGETFIVLSTIEMIPLAIYKVIDDNHVEIVNVLPIMFPES